MTAREVVDLIKKNSNAPWNERSYRDTFKVGNPDATVKGIAVTMMTTFGMLKRAQAAGLNMVVTHEDTFWNDRDDTKDLTDNPLYKLKTDFVIKNDMVVWRDHDNMHAMKPDSLWSARFVPSASRAAKTPSWRREFIPSPRRRSASSRPRLSGSPARARFAASAIPKPKSARSSLAPGMDAAHDARKPMSLSAANSRKPTGPRITSNTCWMRLLSAWRRA